MAIVVFVVILFGDAGQVRLAILLVGAGSWQRADVNRIYIAELGCDNGAPMRSLMIRARR
jgi:hypothetical protein